MIRAMMPLVRCNLALVPWRTGAEWALTLGLTPVMAVGAILGLAALHGLLGV